ncbi:hypothetical protein ACFYKX_05290 [Cytobacillus sp. FJAT-54145]|uniref:Protein YoqH n=1 Tax=Cytobacillus spartinae TaxID=3299023 RepID=A0ABW6K777_9BACI
MRVLIMIFLILFSGIPTIANANKLPCSIILEPVDQGLKYAKGTALVYKVRPIPQSFERTNVSILAVHLPEPSSYGNYDRYEGLAFIPGEISWRFPLYPTPENLGPSWAGRFDFITAEMKNVIIQVRLSHSKEEKLGPSVLSNTINSCK